MYMQKHNRNLCDPWSLRQTGVYHQLSRNLTVSFWIFLNLGDGIKSFLQNSFEFGSNRYHLALHAKLLMILGSNWTEYIEFLGSELKKQVSITRYTSIQILNC